MTVQDDYIRQIVDAAPPLTDQRRNRIAALLGGGVAADNAVRESQHEQARERAAFEQERAEREERARIEQREARRKAALRCALYRHFDDAGVLLYVGISKASDQRRTQHLSASRWFRFHDRETVEWLTREQVEAAMKALRHSRRGAAELAAYDVVEAELRALREDVIDLRGWTCESCYDTNRHHCTVCIAAGRS